jgi:hypothetical protein
VSFFAQLKHLLPDSLAWRPKDATREWLIGEDHYIGEPGLFVGGFAGAGLRLWRFIKGLGEEPANVRTFIDEVHGDAFPTTTRDLEEWERQFGIEPNASEAVRRLALAAEWRATGGQSPDYLQGVVQAAGFNLWIHEWWSSGPPYVARDPRTYTQSALIGTYQCRPNSDPNQAQCRPKIFDDQPQCNAFMVRDPGYIVNRDLAPRAPPPIPDDATKFPYFLYWGAQTFPARATVPLARKDELDRLLLKLCPAQQWLVMLVDYV